MSRGDGSVGDRPAKRRRGSPSAFVVVVDGREFRMSQTMLEHDAPNYFTAMFNVRRFGKRSLTLDRAIGLKPRTSASISVPTMTQSSSSSCQSSAVRDLT